MTEYKKVTVYRHLSDETLQKQYNRLVKKSDRLFRAGYSSRAEDLTEVIGALADEMDNRGMKA